MKPFHLPDHAGSLRKVLVIELLGLGDNVHLLPALYQLRQALPDAELHVMSRAHTADLFATTPWVDQVWRYPVLPRKPGKREHLQLIRALRAQQFDLVLNTSSNDRSTWLTALSGAKRRVGRVPRKGRLLHWKLSHDYEIDARYGDRPMWQQKAEALRDAGIPLVKGPRFHVERPALDRIDLRVRALDGRRYLHVSPFSAEDCRGLPDREALATIKGLQALDPSLPLVVSIGPTAREAKKWQVIAAGLDVAPAVLFAGDLDTLSFLRLVAGARLHVGPDSGGLHIARMFGVPTVSWVRDHVAAEWAADEPGSIALVSRRQNAAGVCDVDAAQVVEAAAHCLAQAPSFSAVGA